MHTWQVQRNFLEKLHTSGYDWTFLWTIRPDSVPSPCKSRPSVTRARPLSGACRDTVLHTPLVNASRRTRWWFDQWVHFATPEQERDRCCHFVCDEDCDPRNYRSSRIERKFNFIQIQRVFHERKREMLKCKSDRELCIDRGSSSHM